MLRSPIDMRQKYIGLIPIHEFFYFFDYNRKMYEDNI
jgi:hypothetical protein